VDIPVDYSKKVDEIRDYFEGSFPGISIHTNSEIDTRNVAFRFDKGTEVLHVLKITNKVLEDSTTAEVVRKLEDEKWREVLNEAGNKPVILTSQGFKFQQAAAN